MVVDASKDDATREVCREFEGSLRVDWMRSTLASAARQSNEGAAMVDSPLIAFMDDDVVLPNDVFEKMRTPFETTPTGIDGSPVVGVAARIQGLEHSAQRGLLRAHYRLQAGYDHPHYGAKVFGPAINTLPCYEDVRREHGRRS